MNTDTLLQSEGSSSQKLYEIILKMIAEEYCSQTQTSKSEIQILDLGCGQGTFLKHLSAHGFPSLTGADGFEYPAVNSAPFKFSKVDLNQPLPFLPDHFSVVTAIEVIEHLENPRHFVREISRILKPGGWAIVSTPNNECITSMLSLLTRGYFSSFSDENYPAHITPVLGIDLKRMLTESKLKPDSVVYSNQGRIPKSSIYWQTLFPFLKGRLFSDNFIGVGMKSYDTK